MAGPVIGAAVVVDKESFHGRPPIEGVCDPAKLDTEQLRWLYEQLVQHPAIRWTVASVSHKSVDHLNIIPVRGCRARVSMYDTACLAMLCAFLTSVCAMWCVAGHPSSMQRRCRQTRGALADVGDHRLPWRAATVTQQVRGGQARANEQLQRRSCRYHCRRPAPACDVSAAPAVADVRLSQAHGSADCPAQGGPTPARPMPST